MRSGFLAILAIAALTLGCDNSGDSSTTTPTTPTATASVVETFTGTVDPQGSASHNFNVPTTGTVNVTLTAVGPPSTIFMGLGIGVPGTDGACALISTATTSTQASQTPQLGGTASPGPLCVKIFDIGNQTAAVSYTITVAHP